MGRNEGGRGQQAWGGSESEAERGVVMETYKKFLEHKTHVGADHGFDPAWMPDNKKV